MDSDWIIKIIYTFFLGALLALFVGVGINTFYPAPTMPERNFESSRQVTEEQKARQLTYNTEYKEYQEDLKLHKRNTSIIALIGAVIFLSSSLIIQKRTAVIADGVMLGGLFTLFYSIVRGVNSEFDEYLFVVITIGLVVVLYLGHRRFMGGRVQTGKSK